MPFLQWSSRYSVGVAEFDQHHQVLIRLINQLHDAMSQGKGGLEVGGIVDELARYTVFHFSAEEKVMKARAYRETASHLQAHKDFVDRVRDFQARHRAGQLALSIEVITFLKDWLTGHILDRDKKMCADLAN